MAGDAVGEAVEAMAHEAYVGGGDLAGDVGVDGVEHGERVSWPSPRIALRCFSNICTSNPLLLATSVKTKPPTPPPATDIRGFLCPASATAG